ncbi:deoxyuridine 5'-triphosphate nucleotidohydrolase [Helicobacter enhydrae]|uniref:Deoxyuridine 5'-triphosphate nucleotidohydrolase n=1 Tax=Helicobacter enhydrae TaxID=222136 RepID=A0A1B1U4P2_9HELI|nr:dUTP diphosphatase [Helicobacter enhydrae]ANV97665.1 deoxyuridine 5'-triphosphate nucleotidohydrolase [Helicobacter enhydrae]
MQIKVKKLHHLARIPRYQSVGSAGFDLHSVENVRIKPKQWKLIKTGLAFEFDSDFEMQIRSRSGLALKNGIAVLNAPGTIDSDYRGEIGVVLINHSEEEFEVGIGDRIAQGVFAPVIQVELIESEVLSETERGAGGFGSSGVASKK